MNDDETLTDAEIERLWAWGLHEDSLFSDRVNFMCASEALLFAAFTTVAGNDDTRSSLGWYVAGIGILITVLWIYLWWVQTRYTTRPLKKLCRKYINTYAGIVRPKWLIGPHVTLGAVLPSIILAVWVAMLLQ